MSYKSLDLIKRKMDESMRFMAYIYMYLARPSLNLESFGKKGEIAIRRGLRAHANTRGKWTRKWHRKMGLPLNVESLQRYWYGSSTLLAGEQGHGNLFEESVVFKPYYVCYRFAPCQWHDVWKEEGFEREGLMYCNETHQEVAMAYHPNAIVEIHENLNKGDSYCFFKWMMPPEISQEKIDRSGYKKMDERMRENPEQELLASLKRQTRCVALLYSCISDSLIKQFGKGGEDVVRKALRDVGLKEAERIKIKLKDSGKKLTIKNALNELDLPYGVLWKINIKASNSVFKAAVEYCPFAEVWRELAHEELGLIYCQEFCKDVFGALSTKADAQISECMMKKDNKCTFESKIKGK